MRFRKYISFIFILGCWLFSTQESAAQQEYPFVAKINLTSPYSVYLNDYANPNQQNISLTLINRDLVLGSRSVRLKFFLEGIGFSIESRESVIGASPVILSSGAPYVMPTADIATYFRPENLNVAPNVYAQSLPEGTYRFGVQIFDAQTGKQLSIKTFTNYLWLKSNQPPFLNLPENQSFVAEQLPQNVVFQWTPRHFQLNNVEYEFILTELIVPNGFSGNLQHLFFSQPPYFTTTTRATSFLYGPTMPPLIKGRTYGWAVRAVARRGIDEIGVFENRGYSEVHFFKYLTPEFDPPALRIASAMSQDTIMTIKPHHIDFRWNKPVDYLGNPINTFQYTLKIARLYPGQLPEEVINGANILEYKVNGKGEFDYGIDQPQLALGERYVAMLVTQPELKYNFRNEGKSNMVSFIFGKPTDKQMALKKRRIEGNIYWTFDKNELALGRVSGSPQDRWIIGSTAVDVVNTKLVRSDDKKPLAKAKIKVFLDEAENHLLAINESGATGSFSLEYPVEAMRGVDISNKVWLVIDHPIFGKIKRTFFLNQNDERTVVTDDDDLIFIAPTFRFVPMLLDYGFLKYINEPMGDFTVSLYRETALFNTYPYLRYENFSDGVPGVTETIFNKPYYKVAEGKAGQLFAGLFYNSTDVQDKFLVKIKGSVPYEEYYFELFTTKASPSEMVIRKITEFYKVQRGNPYLTGTIRLSKSNAATQTLPDAKVSLMVDGKEYFAFSNSNGVYRIEGFPYKRGGMSVPVVVSYKGTKMAESSVGISSVTLENVQDFELKAKEQVVVAAQLQNINNGIVEVDIPDRGKIQILPKGNLIAFVCPAGAPVPVVVKRKGYKDVALQLNTKANILASNPQSPLLSFASGDGARISAFQVSIGYFSFNLFSVFMSELATPLGNIQDQANLYYGGAADNGIIQLKEELEDYYVNINILDERTNAPVKGVYVNDGITPVGQSDVNGKLVYKTTINRSMVVLNIDSKGLQSADKQAYAGTEVQVSIPDINTNVFSQDITVLLESGSFITGTISDRNLAKVANANVRIEYTGGYKDILADVNGVYKFRFPTTLDESFLTITAKSPRHVSRTVYVATNKSVMNYKRDIVLSIADPATPTTDKYLQWLLSYKKLYGYRVISSKLDKMDFLTLFDYKMTISATIDTELGPLDFTFIINLSAGELLYNLLEEYKTANLIDSKIAKAYPQGLKSNSTSIEVNGLPIAVSGLKLKLIRVTNPKSGYAYFGGIFLDDKINGLEPSKLTGDLKDLHNKFQTAVMLDRTTLGFKTRAFQGIPDPGLPINVCPDLTDRKVELVAIVTPTVTDPEATRVSNKMKLTLSNEEIARLTSFKYTKNTFIHNNLLFKSISATKFGLQIDTVSAIPLFMKGVRISLMNIPFLRLSGQDINNVLIDYSASPRTINLGGDFATAKIKEVYINNGTVEVVFFTNTAGNVVKSTNPNNITDIVYNADGIRYSHYEGQKELTMTAAILNAVSFWGQENALIPGDRITLKAKVLPGALGSNIGLLRRANQMPGHEIFSASTDNRLFDGFVIDSTSNDKDSVSISIEAKNKFVYQVHEMEVIWKAIPDVINKKTNYVINLIGVKTLTKGWDEFFRPTKILANMDQDKINGIIEEIRQDSTRMAEHSFDGLDGQQDLMSSVNDKLTTVSDSLTIIYKMAMPLVDFVFFHPINVVYNPTLKKLVGVDNIFQVGITLPTVFTAGLYGKIYTDPNTEKFTGVAVGADLTINMGKLITVGGGGGYRNVDGDWVTGFLFKVGFENPGGVGKNAVGIAKVGKFRLYKFEGAVIYDSINEALLIKAGGTIAWNDIEAPGPFSDMSDKKVSSTKDETTDKSVKKPKTNAESDEYIKNKKEEANNKKKEIQDLENEVRTLEQKPNRTPEEEQQLNEKSAALTTKKTELSTIEDDAKREEIGFQYRKYLDADPEIVATKKILVNAEKKAIDDEEAAITLEKTSVKTLKDGLPGKKNDLRTDKNKLTDDKKSLQDKRDDINKLKINRPDGLNAKNDALNAKKTEQNTENANKKAKTKEQNTAQKEFDSADKKVQTQQGKVDKLLSKTNRTAAEDQKLAEERATLTTLTNTKTGKQTILDQKKRENAEIDTKITNITTAISDLEREINLKTQEINRKTTEADTEEGRIKTVEEDIKKREDDINKDEIVDIPLREKNVEDREKALDTRKTQYDKDEEELKKAQEKVDFIEQKKRDLEAAGDTYALSVIKDEENLIRLTKALTLKEDMVNAKKLKAENEKNAIATEEPGVKQERIEVDAEKARLKPTGEKLEKDRPEIERKKTENTAEREEVTRETTEISTKKKQLDTDKKAIDKDQSGVDKLKDKRDNGLTAKNDADQAVTNKNAQLQPLRDKNTSNPRTITKSEEKELSKGEKELVSLQSTATKRADDYNNAKRDFDDADALLQTKKTNANQLETEINTRETNNNNRNTELTRKENAQDIKDFDTEDTKYTTEKEALDTREAALITKENNLKSRKTKNELDFNDVAKDEKVLAELKAKKLELEKLQASNEALQARIKELEKKKTLTPTEQTELNSLTLELTEKQKAYMKMEEQIDEQETYIEATSNAAYNAKRAKDFENRSPLWMAFMGGVMETLRIPDPNAKLLGDNVISDAEITIAIGQIGVCMTFAGTYLYRAERRFEAAAMIQIPFNTDKAGFRFFLGVPYFELPKKIGPIGNIKGNGQFDINTLKEFSMVFMCAVRGEIDYPYGYLPVSLRLGICVNANTNMTELAKTTTIGGDIVSQKAKNLLNMQSSFNTIAGNSLTQRGKLYDAIPDAFKPKNRFSGIYFGCSAGIYLGRQEDIKFLGVDFNYKVGIGLALKLGILKSFIDESYEIRGGVELGADLKLVVAKPITGQLFDTHLDLAGFCMKYGKERVVTSDSTGYYDYYGRMIVYGPKLEFQIGESAKGNETCAGGVKVDFWYLKVCLNPYAWWDFETDPKTFIPGWKLKGSGWVDPPKINYNTICPISWDY